MDQFLQALQQFGTTAYELVYAVAAIILPWLPLIAWVMFWMFTVNWNKLRLILASGGWIGVALIAIVAVLVWGAVAPPPGGFHAIFGLRVTNYVEKTVYVSGLICIMLAAGSVQLSGFWGDCCNFEEQILIADAGDGHSHDHGGHSHDHDQGGHSHDHGAELHVHDQGGSHPHGHPLA